MEQALHRSSRTGWRDEESDTLFSAVREASRQGTPLRSVFEQVASSLGRKPNSIRNYYYAQLRQRPETGLNRAAPFQTFTEEEVRELLRTVLMARGQGISVRACVMRMAGGDRGLMLRYQNKYRSILKNRPHLLAELAEDLRQEGIAVPENPDSSRQQDVPVRTASQLNRAQQLAQALGDPAVQQMLDGLNTLLQRALAFRGRDKTVELDRLQITYDLARMRWEDEQNRLHEAVNDMLNICREFLGMTMDRRQEGLDDFSGLLAIKISSLENLLTKSS
jgi:hypothetical protein